MREFVSRQIVKINWESDVNPVRIAVTLLLIAYLLYASGFRFVLTLLLFFAIAWVHSVWIGAFVSALRTRARPSFFDTLCFVVGAACVGASFYYGYGAVGSMTVALPVIILIAYVIDGWARKAWRRLRRTRL